MTTCSQAPIADVASASNMVESREDIVGMDVDDLCEWAKNNGLPSFRGKQLYQWIYAKGCTDFQAMTNIAQPLREELAKKLCIHRPEVIEEHCSSDGTIKWLVRFVDGNEAETVFIPEEDRGTLCISSQVGCTLNCSFCHTGTQRLVRNLSTAEIVGQVMMARDRLGQWPNSSNDAPRRLTNIVMMGMGEPLYNTENVIKSLKLLSDGEGISLSRRRITLSTSGIVPQIHRAINETGVSLAISLHATTDELRDQLVPINKKYPLAALLDTIRQCEGVSNARRVTWEYVMLKDVNDQPEDAKRLLQLIKGIPSKINLIPFNPWPGSGYETSSKKAIERFARIIMDAGYPSPVRTPRGSDILAACGQLKSASEKQPKKQRVAPQDSATIQNSGVLDNISA